MYELWQVATCGELNKLACLLLDNLGTLLILDCKLALVDAFLKLLQVAVT